MKRSIILASVVCLLIGAGGAYGASYAVYQPKIESYENQISSQEATISSQETTISAQEAEISTLGSEKSRLQVDLSAAQAQAEAYKEQATGLSSQLSNTQKRLDNILGIKVTQYYEWSYQWETWQWELAIPLSLYVEYQERSRPASWLGYVDMATDPGDDRYIDQMFQQINSAALGAHFTEAQKLNFLVAFVQSLPYTVDSETTPWDEYPRYPIETLFDRGGDCEDTSILAAALLDRMGYDVALLVLENAKHMAVGVSISDIYGRYYEYAGKRYFYLETTGDGWEIGQIPPTISDTHAYVYPLRS